ncbi:MAG: PhoH family protein [Planctomycetota bacterium]
MADLTISLRNIDEERTLLGHLDRNLRILRQRFGVEATSRGGHLVLAGEPDRVGAAADLVRRALALIRDDGVGTTTVTDLFGGEERPARDGNSIHVRMAAQPRSPNQKRYMEAIWEHPVTFGIGPAGTGKTFLAVAVAVSLVKAGDYRRIVLVRPAVEAGEHLGFLPGDLEAKITPYLQPLYDSLQSLLPKGLLKRYMDEGAIEICPLAYMRGRTLDHSVIILDEAQNTTVAQMKMFLTRMGTESKIVVTGDLSQVDLPGRQESGLANAVRVLRGVEDIEFCNFHKDDIVRHEVVQRIVRAYGSWEERIRQREAADRDDADGGTSSRPPRGEDAARQRKRRS